MASTGNWSDLPQDILEQIAERLTSCEDCIRFRGVSTSWRATVVVKHNHTFFRKMLPWLVLPQQDEEPDDDDDDINNTHSFFSLSDKKLHPLNLPEAVDCSDCWGSPYGWFLTLRNSQVSIVNLISNVCIHLPPLTSFESYSQNPSAFSVRKLILQISPSSSSTAPLPLQDQFLAFLIFRGEGINLGFSRPGDISWTIIENIRSTINEDILQIDNKFYVVDNEGEVGRFDISEGDRVVQDYAEGSDEIDVYELCLRFYLVEMLGDLHLVVRVLDLETRPLDNYHLEHSRPFEQHHNAHTRSFEVFRMDLGDEDWPTWEQVYDLGDYAFFVGNNTSFSLLVSENAACKRSAIYFTDDYNSDSSSRGLDMGIYNLETHELEPIFSSDDVVTFFAPAFWITPSLCLGTS